MSESRAFRKLKDALSGHGRRIERVENLLASGWPDVNGCFHGVEFWIEIKEPVEPKRSSTPLFGSNHKLSVEQRNWAVRQMSAGGLVYIYIDTGRHRMLIGGSKVDEINNMSVQELLDIALWHGRVPFKDKIHWEGIVDVILCRKI